MINNTKLFEFIYDAVISDGGDGDMAVVFTTQSHTAAADQFEKFLAAQTYGVWQRSDRTDGDIVFWENQESFVFASNDHFCCFSDAITGQGYPTGKVPASQKIIISG